MSLPIGLLPGTITATDVKCDRFDFDVVHTVLTIRCDDVRWLDHETQVWLRDGRRRDGFARVLGVKEPEHAAFLGRRGMFIFDVYRGDSVIAWGATRHGSVALQDYLATCTPEVVKALASSCGVLPYQEPPSVSIGLYR